MAKERKNELGQPIGEPVVDFRPCLPPPRREMVGRYCRVTPLHIASDAVALYSAFSADASNRIWTYLPYGPFEKAEDYHALLEEKASGDDPIFFGIRRVEATAPEGVAAYMRIEPVVGVLEVGHLCFSPALQNTRAATESMYLMMRLVFEELGYRRYEWKCDALNEKSRAAALRLGFRFEGIFRQATIYKGRSRDTAWFSIIDSEWPVLRSVFEAWLDPANFDENGVQRTRLATRNL